MATSRMLTKKEAATASSTCPSCGITFGAKSTPAGYWYISTYCSKKCGRASWGNKRKTLTCPICSTPFVERRGKTKPQKYCTKRCSEIGMRNPQGWIRRRHGYTVFWTGKAEVQWHRIVMERRLGRPLRDTETVHHLNGQRDDNADANLELWDHAQPHGQRVPDKIAWCIEFLGLHGYHVSAPHSATGTAPVA